MKYLVFTCTIPDDDFLAADRMFERFSTIIRDKYKTKDCTMFTFLPTYQHRESDCEFINDEYQESISTSENRD